MGRRDGDGDVKNLYYIDALVLFPSFLSIYTEVDVFLCLTLFPFDSMDLFS